MSFIYLGVLIFRVLLGHLICSILQINIIFKMAAWKGYVLSMACRLMLVKSLIQSTPTHTISIYSWPISLLKYIERTARNFIWSGVLNKRKLVMVAWNKMCKPQSHGGLGLRSLIRFNKASNLKLGWDLIISEESLATILKGKSFKSYGTVKHHIFFTHWFCIKIEYSTINNHSS